MTPELLLTSAEMREVDALSIASGTAGFDLMLRAGAAVATFIEGLPATGRVLVLCGPGNNGGDGFVAARLLLEAGRAVEVASLLSPEALKGDAALAAAGWTGAVGSLDDARPEEASVVVDALFGTGLARDLDGVVAAVIGRVNAAGASVIAVDIASGIDTDSGAIRGVAIKADHTVTFAARKPGHLLEPGRRHAGIVEVADIGIPQDVLRGFSQDLFANGPDLWSDLLPRLRAAGHKYDRGHALVMSGPPAHTGASRLAARGTLRAGAGLVTLITSARALAVNAAHLTAIMLRVADDPDELSDLLTDDRFNAIALGPALGIGDATRAWVSAALEADRATVLDADALTSFAGDAKALAELLGAGREAPAVLTPHDGEFKRLFAGPAETWEDARSVAAAPSKVGRARRAASLMGAIVILKGPDTVIAAPDGRAAINENGSPHLATAGSGDVLTGIVTGLLAQGMPGFEAACAAVWMHADAASRFGPGLIAEDLPEALPAVLRGLAA